MSNNYKIMQSALMKQFLAISEMSAHDPNFKAEKDKSLVMTSLAGTYIKGADTTMRALAMTQKNKKLMDTLLPGADNEEGTENEKSLECRNN